jgi:4-hydroxy-2-oxoheptanedioate aldolase
MVEIIALAGFEAVILDTEHGAYGIHKIRELVLAADAHGIFSIARVRANDSSLIGAVLDAGADGVLVPQIESKAGAMAAVSAARFSPEGARGANPWVRAAGYSGIADWFGQANRDVAVMVMIEGTNGVAALPEILETPGLDGVFLGPVDLSHALGVPGQLDHPRVLEKIQEVIGTAESKSMAVAIFTPTADGANRWFARGITCAAVGVDTGHVLAGFKTIRQAVRTEPGSQ